VFYASGDTGQGCLMKDLQPVYEPSLPGDIEHSLADISKAKEIGYDPEYDLEAGLKQTIASAQAL
ncbi:unnamed protein product, partial [marine sediment metagenome]